ncbi:hypothetical protein SDC9_198207 [bioreactor metagenome]|uniref:Uncharacterized protein n=1 Tax=bioreactor metagenome TaxID=1076179 RepID=A0A645IHV8_9ZZZZ
MKGLSWYKLLRHRPDKQAADQAVFDTGHDAAEDRADEDAAGGFFIPFGVDQPGVEGEHRIPRGADG